MEGCREGSQSKLRNGEIFPMSVQLASLIGQHYTNQTMVPLVVKFITLIWFYYLLTETLAYLGGGNLFCLTVVALALSLSDQIRLMSGAQLEPINSVIISLWLQIVPCLPQRTLLRQAVRVSDYLGRLLLPWWLVSSCPPPSLDRIRSLSLSFLCIVWSIPLDTAGEHDMIWYCFISFLWPISPSLYLRVLSYPWSFWPGIKKGDSSS